MKIMHIGSELIYMVCTHTECTLTDFKQLINANKNSFFYSTEITYYSTTFPYEAIVNKSGFNTFLTNSSDAHVYEHTCSPNNGSKNQLKIVFIPHDTKMPYGVYSSE